ncbi:hypothetical protein BHYA_0009g00750 [Botrytis hyacinthi]|uniref:Uncharacterized protein n=1 Tax=Botrytis hyacinthi TaxID=278943 RepID=A0A4Z1GZP0_9HELO|nr:hypothetical protein BHYA_0009g00750 [Botrytis hyacinthi]
MSFGTSTPRICNERYYYVQDPAVRNLFQQLPLIINIEAVLRMEFRQCGIHHRGAPPALSVGKELGGSDGMIEHDSGSDERSRYELSTSYSG